MRELGNTDAVVTKYMAAMVEKDNAIFKPRTRRRRASSKRRSQAPEIVDIHPQHRPPLRRRPRRSNRHRRSRHRRLARLRPGAVLLHRSSHQRSRTRRHHAADRRLHDAQSHWAGFRRHEHRARRATIFRPCPPATSTRSTSTSSFPNCILRRFLSRPPSPTERCTHYRNCDWIDNAIVLQMSPAEGQIYGHIHLPCRVEVNRRLVERAAALSHAEPNVG